MPLVRIDGRMITNWESFHNVFADAFGFPGFYGRNMNAWIDCMTGLDDRDSGLSTINGSATDPVVLQIDNIDDIYLCDPEMYKAIVDCAGFVNWRRIEKGEPAILALSFYRSPS